MLYASLNFSIYVTDFDPASYRLVSTLLLFRNNIPVPLFVFFRKNCPAITNTIFHQGCQIGSFGAQNQTFGSFEKQLAPKFLFGYLATFWLFCNISFHKFFLEKSCEWCVQLVPATIKREVGHHTVV